MSIITTVKSLTHRSVKFVSFLSAVKMQKCFRFCKSKIFEFFIEFRENAKSFTFARAVSIKLFTAVIYYLQHGQASANRTKPGCTDTPHNDI